MSKLVAPSPKVSSPLPVPFPVGTLRHHVVYRPRVPGVSVGVRGCGFMLKPTGAGAYVGRRIRDYVLVYVLRGTGTFTDWHGRMHRVAAGDAFQVPAGRRHSGVQDPDGRWAEAYVTIDGPLGNVLARTGAIDVARPVLRPGADLGLIERFDRILRDLAAAPDAELPATTARAHELLVTVHALDRRRREREGADPHAAMVEAARLLLARDPHDRAGVAAVARHLGLSYERFRKVFRERVGLSPAAYRIRHRIDRAKALIAQERLGNKQVAYALGYPDPFTFSKQFKHVVGLSPDAFRRTV